MFVHAAGWLLESLFGCLFCQILCCPCPELLITEAHSVVGPCNWNPKATMGWPWFCKTWWTIVKLKSTMAPQIAKKLADEGVSTLSQPAMILDAAIRDAWRLRLLWYQVVELLLKREPIWKDAKGREGQSTWSKLIRCCSRMSETDEAHHISSYSLFSYSVEAHTLSLTSCDLRWRHLDWLQATPPRRRKKPPARTGPSSIGCITLAMSRCVETRGTNVFLSTADLIWLDTLDRLYTGAVGLFDHMPSAEVASGLKLELYSSCSEILSTTPTGYSSPRYPSASPHTSTGCRCLAVKWCSWGSFLWFCSHLSLLPELCHAFPLHVTMQILLIVDVCL